MSKKNRKNFLKNEKELETTNPLTLLHLDFNVSYATIADVFGYSKGYVYSYTSYKNRDSIPKPLARMCDAMRTIFRLKIELKNYEALQNLLQYMSCQKSSDDLKDFDAIFKNNL